MPRRRPQLLEGGFHLGTPKDDVAARELMCARAVGAVRRRGRALVYPAPNCLAAVGILLGDLNHRGTYVETPFSSKQPTTNLITDPNVQPAHEADHGPGPGTQPTSTSPLSIPVHALLREV